MQSKHPTRPKDLVYGLNETPPLFKLIFLALQQLFMIALYLILITVVAKKAFLKPDMAQSMISFTFLAMGIATAIQAIPKGPVGSGFLASSCVAPNYLQAAITAVSIGGLSLLSGMMIFSGLCESLFALFIKKLRFLFPRVVSGLIFCFIALSVGIVAFHAIFITSYPLNSKEYLLSTGLYSFTLLLIIALNIWAKGILRLLCIIIGLSIGSLIAYFLNLFSAAGLQQLNDAAYIKLPDFSYIGYQFRWALTPLFIITALAASLRTLGVLTTCQQINDARWRRTEPTSIRKGVLADGISAAISGLFGTMGVGVSPSSVGISKATGATSRSIAFAVAILCILCALIPKISAFFLALPLNVVSAGLTFASCLMFVGGLRIITSQELDARKTIVIGLSLLFALSPEIFPQYFRQLPQNIQPIAQSGMILGTLTAIILNLLFRIGIKRKHQFIFEGETEDSFKAMQITLKNWGVDPVIVDSVIDSTRSLYQIILSGNYSSSNIEANISYDEIQLTLVIKYQGKLPEISLEEPITEEDLVDENVFFKGLSSLYKGVYADKIQSRVQDEQVKISLGFDL